MNIGITVYPTYGGSGIVGSELGKELAERGHTVHFISSALPTRLTQLGERVRFHEVEMMSYPLFEHQPYTLALATKMADVAETEDLDLLHVHYAIPHSISAILARESLKPRRTLPVVTTLHGTDITLVGADRSYLPITRYGIAQSDGVTAVSHYLKQATAETFQFEHIAVIPNFICASDYSRKPKEDLRRELAPAGEPLLCHVSNFRPVKRPVDCVEILARVREKGVNARLVMVGDGSERSRAEHRARCLNVERYCSFVGKQLRIAWHQCTRNSRAAVNRSQPAAGFAKALRFSRPPSCFRMRCHIIVNGGRRHSRTLPKRPLALNSRPSTLNPPWPNNHKQRSRRRGRKTTPNGTSRSSRRQTWRRTPTSAAAW